jgi:hypothetical protein
MSNVSTADTFTRLRVIREGSGSNTYMLMNGDAGIAEGTPTGPGTTFRLLGVPVRVSTQVPGLGRLQPRGSPAQLTEHLWLAG